jgi:hypothetical protein
MDGLKASSRSAALVAERLGAQGFTLVDIGCNGGLDRGWAVFGDGLKAFAFDPAVLEVERLRRAETRPLVRYIAGYVGLPVDHPLRRAPERAPFTHKSPWPRLSAAHKMGEGETFSLIQDWVPHKPPPGLDEEIAAYERQRAQGRPAAGKASPRAEDLSGVSDAEIRVEAGLMRRNLWDKATLSDPDDPIVPEDFFAAEGVDDIDFIKLDVDGADYEILQALGPLFHPARVLALSVEINFQGSHLPYQHTFHNTDRFLRSHGFDLFDLTVKRYASAALPSPFLRPHASETVSGRTLQGDALYVRDFGFRQPGADPDDYSPVKLARLAALFCMFNLLDQAAETAIRFRAELSTLLDVDELLESLALEAQEGEITRFTYAEYIEKFAEGHPYFFNREHQRRYIERPTFSPIRPQAPGTAAEAPADDPSKGKLTSRPGPQPSSSHAADAQAQGGLIPTSLGQTLESRFQIVRHLFSRLYPDEPENVVRWCVFDPEAASYVFEPGIFDRQITPPDAVCAYLEYDFQHIFDLEDLEVTHDGLELINRRLRTTHPGLVPFSGDVLTLDGLRVGYESAKRTMDALAADFRARLGSPEPRLYVLSEAPSPDSAERLIAILRARAAHPFRLLIHTRDSGAAALIPRWPEIDIHLAPAAIGKPAAQSWEGDDADWDRALGAYNLAPALRPRGGRATPLARSV